MHETVMAKKMISFRVDPGLLDLLDEVSATPDTMFYDRGRTWLIEYAIKQTYNGMSDQNKNKMEESAKPIG